MNLPTLIWNTHVGFGDWGLVVNRIAARPEMGTGHPAALRDGTPTPSAPIQSGCAYHSALPPSRRQSRRWCRDRLIRPAPDPGRGRCSRQWVGRERFVLHFVNLDGRIDGGLTYCSGVASVMRFPNRRGGTRSPIAPRIATLRALADSRRLEPWQGAGQERIGWYAASPTPGEAQRVILFHGNGGQAVDRDHYVRAFHGRRPSCDGAHPGGLPDHAVY